MASPGNRFPVEQHCRRDLLTLILFLVTVSLAQAHLMVAQRGTLNDVDDGAYMVLSLPVSAFSGVDDDNDGTLSPAEFSRHNAELASTVKNGVQLLDAQGARPLQGLLLSLAPADDGVSNTASQVIAMGRFALHHSGADTATGTDSSKLVRPGTLPETRETLRLFVNLFDTADAERTFHITATRKADQRKQLIILTPAQPTSTVFPSA